MTGLFLRLFNIGVTAGWIVLAVLGIKLLFRKLPKWISCLLWGIVALRLLLPFTLESPLSLLPSPELIPQDIAVSQTPAIQSGIPAVNRVVNPLFATVMAPDSVSLEGCKRLHRVAVPVAGAHRVHHGQGHGRIGQRRKPQGAMGKAHQPGS